MPRVAQPDLFAPSPSPPPPPGPDPVAELTALLQQPRAIGLARLAGPEGEALAQAIMVETERLLAATE